MSLKDKKYKRIYRILFWIILVISVGTIVFLLEEISKLEMASDEEKVSLSKYDEVQEELNFYVEVIKSDNLWIYDNKISEAKSQFQNLLDQSTNTKIQDELEKRIQYAEDWENAKQDDELDRINLRRKLSAQSRLIDSIKIASEVSQLSTKSLELQKDRKIDSLIIQLNDKKEELKRQQKVQVISFTNDAGNLVHYIGEIQNEQANGGGIGIWDNGSVYKGDWENNKRHGNGEFKWKDGARYEGDFVYGARSGMGKFYYKSGERYEGEFKDGLRHGEGVLYDKNGNKSFDGKWKNDQPIQK